LEEVWISEAPWLSIEEDDRVGVEGVTLAGDLEGFGTQLPLPRLANETLAKTNPEQRSLGKKTRRQEEA